jgi:hypothetical protein
MARNQPLAQELDRPENTAYTADSIRKAVEGLGKSKMQAESEAQQNKAKNEKNKGKTLSVAQQASLSEKGRERAKMSVKNKSQGSTSPVTIILDKKAGGMANRQSEEVAPSLSETPRHELRLLSNSGRNLGKQPSDRIGKLRSPERSHARFGINDALAAFQNSINPDVSEKTHPGRKRRSSEVILSPEEKPLLLEYSSGFQGKGSGHQRDGSQNTSIASQIEERILQEQRNVTASMSHGIGRAHPGFAQASVAPELSRGNESRKAVHQTSLASNGGVAMRAPNFQGSRIYPGSGAKVGASYSVDHGYDIRHFSVPAPAGAAMTSLRSSLPSLEPSLRGGYGSPLHMTRPHGHHIYGVGVPAASQPTATRINGSFSHGNSEMAGIVERYQNTLQHELLRAQQRHPQYYTVYSRHGPTSLWDESQRSNPPIKRKSWAPNNMPHDQRHSGRG